MSAGRRPSIPARRVRHRPYLHFDSATWQALAEREPAKPSEAFLRCRHDLRPGPDRPPRDDTALLEAAAFVAGLTRNAADERLLRAHLDAVLASTGMGLVSQRRGRFLAALAFAYDILEDVLPDPEYSALRRTLADHADRAARAVDERLAPPWPFEDPEAVATLAGVQLAALALWPDDDRAGDWIAITDPRLEAVLGAVAPDGWWPTGFDDWNALLPLLVRVADAWERLGDRDRFDHGVFREAAHVALHAPAPNRYDVLDVDRVEWRLPAAEDESSRRSYHWHREPARWALARIGRRFPSAACRAALTYWREAGLGRGTPWSVLWESDPQPVVRPARTHHLFDSHGLAVWRSDWRADALQVALCTGPPYGGRAASSPEWRPAVRLDSDANHFLLSWGGEVLVGDSGRLPDPASAYHNTVVVDGWGQVPSLDLDAWAARLSAVWLSSLGGSLVGEAAGAYRAPAGLEGFERHLAVAPGYLLVWDRLAARRACRYEWLLHSPGRIDAGESGATITVGECALWVQVLRPDRVRIGLKPHHPKDVPAPLGTTLTVACADPVQQTQFLILMTPYRHRGEPLVTATLLTGDTTVGARLAWEDGDREVVLFPTHGRGIVLERLISDAAYLALRRGPDGDWRRLLARRVRRVLIPGGEVVTATQPVDLSFESRAGEVVGELSTATGATVSVRCPFLPRGVLVDGEAGRATIDPHAQITTVRLTAGRHSLRVTAR